MGVFDAFFGCIGDGGFTVATWLCPVREKVRPARSDGGCEREKVRPACEKWPKIGGLWRAGRSFSRLSTRGPVLGEFFATTPLEGPCWASFSRSPGAAGASHRPDMPSTPDGPGRPDVPVGISPGAPRAPGAWRARRRPASRRSGSPALPIRRPSRSSGTSERSRGR